MLILSFRARGGFKASQQQQGAVWIDDADVGARLRVEDNDEVGGACFEEDSAQTAGQTW